MCNTINGLLMLQPPDEFLAAMNESVLKKSAELQEHISMIESGVKEAATILASNKVNSL